MLDNTISALPDFWNGLLVTLELTAVSVAIGTSLGAALALMRFSGIRALEWPAIAYSFYFRGTPLLVQLFLIYYGAGQFQEELGAADLWQWFRSPWFCAILGLSLNTAAYISEILLGGLRAVPKGSLEAAKALALPRLPSLTHIVMPSVIRSAWPAYSNEVIFQLQSTSLVSLLTIMDITGVARQHAARSFAFFEVYLSSGALYLIVVAALLWCFRRVEYDLAKTSR